MNIRSTAFWLKDSLQGKIVRKYYDEVLNDLKSEQGAIKSTKQLQHILQWAVEHVPFYKKIGGENLKQLSDFPIINKFMIKENEDMFLAPQYDKSKLFVETTSGSIGTPLKIYQDPIKRRRAAADTIAFSQFAGYNLGTRLYYSRVWNKYNRKGRAASMLQNIVMQDSDKLSDSELQNFIDALEKDKSEKSVLIFASTLTALYRYMISNNIQTTAKVECFITMSESLAKEVRVGIANLFNTTVVSRYSNCECGIMGQQCKDSDEYHINTTSFYIEILKFDSDEPAEEGERGRIVVTDLYNHAMPLIRYDTGDVAVLSSHSECSMGGPVFKQVDGRRVDCIYSTTGEMLSPYTIINTMWPFNEVKQYQLIQNAEKEYLLKINKQVDIFTQKEHILQALKSYIGYDADIVIEYVSEIPLLSSGKRKQVINNYKK